MGRCILHLSVFSLIFVKFAVLDPYVIGVFQTCANETDGVTMLHVVTDVPAEINALCKDNFTKTFTSSDDVNFYTTAKYTGNSQTDCLLTRKATDEVYWVEVRVSWGEPNAVLLKNSHQYIVTCSLENHATRESIAQNLDNGLVERREIQKHVGKKSKSTFTLEITDVRGNPFPDDSIPIGKTIQLKARLFSNSDEVGLLVSSCCAMDGHTVYPILMGGCGNGVIIPGDMGFITVGNQSTSPFFNIFQLTTGSDIQFVCNFTACQSNCDGQNCISKRRKRNTHYVMESTEVRSAPVHLRLQQFFRVPVPVPVFNPSKSPPSLNLFPRSTHSPMKMAKEYLHHRLENKLKEFMTLMWSIIAGIICGLASAVILGMMFTVYVIGSTGRILKKVKEILKTRRLKF